MKTTSLLIILLILTAVCNIFVTTAQTPNKPACLQLIDSSAYKLVNRDDVCIDTCQSSPTYNLKFGYLANVLFKMRATNLPYYPDSKKLDTNWTVIDTAYSLLRSVLHAIDTTFDHFTLMKLSPSDTGDSFLSQGYVAIFDNYVPFLSVDSILMTIPDSIMKWTWSRDFLYFLPVIESNFEQQNTTAIVFNEGKNEIVITSKEPKNENISIYDIRGNLVLQVKLEGGKTQIGTSSLSSGIYFVKYGSYIKKVIIGSN